MQIHLREKLSRLPWPHQLIVYLMIVATFVFSLYLIEQQGHQFHHKTLSLQMQFNKKEAAIVAAATKHNAALAKQYHTQLVNSQYALCQNGNVVRTELRRFVIKLIPPAKRTLPSNAQFIKETDKAFADQACSKIIAGKSK